MSHELSCSLCLTNELIMEHMYGKNLYDFTEEELQHFPLQYLIEKVGPLELLYAWIKLPSEYRGNFNLQIKLPCFVHYNRPEWRSHIDGPPDSQSRCHVCKWGLERCG